MPSVMERSGAGVLSRSRAKNVTNGNSQPHSEEESSDDEHAHGRPPPPPSVRGTRADVTRACEWCELVLTAWLHMCLTSLRETKAASLLQSVERGSRCIAAAFSSPMHTAPPPPLPPPLPPPSPGALFILAILSASASLLPRLSPSPTDWFILNSYLIRHID